jgi:hypothetical protein
MRVPGFSMMFALAIGSAACTEMSGPEAGAAHPGVLQLAGYDGATLVEPDAALTWTLPPAPQVLVPARILEAPDTVNAGESFEVMVTTIGLSGCWSAVGQTVARMAGVIELTPSDAHSGAAVCTHVLLDLEHRSSVAIDTPGAWILRVRGRRVRQGFEKSDEPVAVERAIVVL